MNLFGNPVFLIILLGVLFALVLVLAVLFFLFTKKPKDDKKKEAETPRFYALKEIDREMEGKKEEEYAPLTFRGICDDFRNYSASELGLYYSEDDVRRFITGLAVSHIMILQGMSGTGKTSLAYAFGKFTGNDSSIIPVQPMWKERTDLIGYYNEFTKKFNETPFLEVLYRANYNKDMFITVLDEMNIARVEYYFAEFLSLLEIPDSNSRRIDVVSDERPSDPKMIKGGCVNLTDNIWFIGTANNDDSTFSISDKVYDRAMIMNLDKRATPFDAENPGKKKINAYDFINLARETYKDYKLPEDVSEKLQKLDLFLQENFYISFGNRINRQITQYLPIYMSCGGTLEEALDDILSKKVFRKLSNGSASLVKKLLEDVNRKLDELFGEESMPLCRAAVLKISMNAR